MSGQLLSAMSDSQLSLFLVACCCEQEESQVTAVVTGGGSMHVAAQSALL